MWDLGGWKFFLASCVLAASVAAGLAAHELQRVGCGGEARAAPPALDRDHAHRTIDEMDRLAMRYESLQKRRLRAASEAERRALGAEIEAVQARYGELARSLRTGRPTTVLCPPGQPIC